MKEQDYVLDYRKKHPRCKYCVFHKFKSMPWQYGYWKCTLKDKVLPEHLVSFLYNLQGCFCEWFIAKEDSIDI